MIGLKKRFGLSLFFDEGVLTRTKHFEPDYRYTDKYIDSNCADELFLIDVSRTLEHRNLFHQAIGRLRENCNVPMVVGGMVWSIDEIDTLFSLGADRILIGGLLTRHRRVELLQKAVAKYGSQSFIYSLNLGFESDGFVDWDGCGFSCNGLSALELNELFKRVGAIELLFNSIVSDGSLQGMDSRIKKLVEEDFSGYQLAVTGGLGTWRHCVQIFESPSVSCVCTSNIFHFSVKAIQNFKANLCRAGIPMRISI